MLGAMPSGDSSCSMCPPVLAAWFQSVLIWPTELHHHYHAGTSGPLGPRGCPPDQVIRRTGAWSRGTDHRSRESVAIGSRLGGRVGLSAELGQRASENEAEP